MQLTGLHVYPVKSMYRLSPASARVEPWGLAGDRRWMLTDATGRFVSQRENPALGQVRTELTATGALVLTTPGGSRAEIPAPSVAVGDQLADVEVWGTRFHAAEAEKEAQLWIAEQLGDYRLVHLDDPRARPVDPAFSSPGDTVSMADGFPMLLTTTASLAELNALIAEEQPEGHETLPMERFRPNAVVSGSDAWAEDGWRRIRIGGLTFRVVKPCGRCVVTTTDQESGERRGPEPLRTLARHHRLLKKAAFGQNLIPERPAGVEGDVLGMLRLGDEVEVLEDGMEWPSDRLV
ncbi:MOSC domain-containing protein [Kitasatospora purpeofusca]|uniref:MOSC domain-containing protein n=1 Tax=Kitasatospora purpeofusca TaxID=67352 RepID=UPI002254C1C3|nr:MOSC N-terminal beta barrel domain-containing protein [Kitasatospora purpeofusca]MCX4756480.1 MOSC domain-containing protein [Kitasatospora purpeofusca]WSR35709.1 MOSC domain-containing protein [Kitasatospora purpeofusca]WSR44016.1 MOSC domain-containing protein [Kitasatospora purpeofusca]